MTPVRTILLLAMLFAVCGYAAEPVGEMSQLMQLNQASEQELWWMQRPATPIPALPTTAEQHYARELQRQQRLEQRQLQESQRREVLLQRHRAPISGIPEARQRLDAINRQRQFQLQQQNQLNRFRTQPGVR